MEYVEKIKKMLCKELDEFAMKQKLTGTDLDMIWKLTDTVKNLGKIEMLEEESGYSEARGGQGGNRGGRGGSSYEMGGSSYDDEMMYSERRGRGRNARRDSMGRYASRQGGSSYDDGMYSEEGGSSYGRGGRGGGGGGRSSYGMSSYGYSEAEGKEMFMEQLEEMMQEAQNPKEKEALHQCMMKLKNA